MWLAQLKGIKIEASYPRHLLFLWLFASFILINIFVNDFRAMLTLTNKESIESLDDLANRDVNISMRAGTYEYDTVTRVI